MAGTTGNGRGADANGASPRLELRGITKRFGAVEALKSVDFEVYPGEVVGLVGDNGAGKSTLVKVIAGTHEADEGTILFEGREVTIRSPTDASCLGIETVYQDLALCDNLDVVGNMFLGREDLSDIVPPVLRTLSEVEMERRTLETLKTLDVKTLRSVRAPVSVLSGGQRQSVAVSKAVMWSAKVVLLDEPTAALGVAQTRQVLELIKRLRDRGLAIVVITHNMHDVFEVVDRVIVLRLGRRAATFDIHETRPEQVVAAITGAEFGEVPAA